MMDQIPTTEKETRTHSPPRRGRILLATASLGAGHNSVARALAGEFERAEVDFQSVDVMSKTRWPFGACYAGGFTLGMTRLPWAYGLGFVMGNRPHTPRRSLAERFRLWTERLGLAPFAHLVEAYQPDVILNTHFIAAPMIAAMIALGRTRARQVITVTDVEMHRWWYSERMAHWFVPSDYTAAFLRPWGVADERVTVSGIPIDPKWDRRVDRAKVLAEWNLPADRKIVVVSGGTEFVCAPVVKIVRDLSDTCPDAHVVVLAGRNKGLLADLSRLAGRSRRIQPLGFTDRVNEVVGVSSLMVTKAGGLTTAECLAAGTPMVLINPVPGQEAGNARYFARQGAAVIARGAKSIVAATRDLLADGESLRRMGRCARQLYLPGRSTISATVLRLLDSGARNADPVGVTRT